MEDVVEHLKFLAEHPESVENLHKIKIQHKTPKHKIFCKYDSCLETITVAALLLVTGWSNLGFR